MWMSFSFRGPFSRRLVGPQPRVSEVMQTSACRLVNRCVLALFKEFSFNCLDDCTSLSYLASSMAVPLRLKLSSSNFSHRRALKERSTGPRHCAVHKAAGCFVRCPVRVQGLYGGADVGRNGQGRRCSHARHTAQPLPSLPQSTRELNLGCLAPTSLTSPLWACSMPRSCNSGIVPGANCRFSPAQSRPARVIGGIPVAELNSGSSVNALMLGMIPPQDSDDHLGVTSPGAHSTILVRADATLHRLCRSASVHLASRNRATSIN